MRSWKVRSNRSVCRRTMSKLTHVSLKNLIASSYSHWDNGAYTHYLDAFSLRPDQTISSLSRGMKMKFSLALALSHHAELLIMDEPFGKLDAQTRYKMQEDLLKMWEQEKRTVIFVTNNIEEACYLGDRIILLSDCPARVKEVYPIDIPRPRDMVSREFLDLRTVISDNTDLSI